MLSLISSDIGLALVPLAIAVVFRLPKFGQEVLAFLRDLRNFRSGN